MHQMKVVKSLIHVSFYPKFTIDIDKKIREYEGQLATISQSLAPLSSFASSLEAQIMNLTNKINNLRIEKERLIGRVGESRNLITPRMNTLVGAQKDAITSLGKDFLVDLKGVEVHAYMLSTLINVLDSFLRGWNEYLKSFKVTYACIFKFLKITIHTLLYISFGRSLPFPLMSKGGREK